MSTLRLFAGANKSVLVIEETADGVFLYQIRVDGFVGDTHHRSIDEAKKQATYSFGIEESAWKDVPATVNDLALFARQNTG